MFFFFFFFNDTATTEIYTLSLHDALPIFTVVDTLSTTDGAVVGTTATTVAGPTFSGGTANAGGLAPPDVIAGDGGGGGWLSGCRDVDESTEQDSWIFGSFIFRFHQQKHWCWRD